ncbi:MAG: hypothetical protein OEU36_04415 [Gammaproteobacteria bacterium]|nr:hypothetical protein [Gammaproteobacteria bacterium]
MRAFLSTVLVLCLTQESNAAPATRTVSYPMSALTSKTLDTPGRRTVKPIDPGLDTPVIGRSVFDFLFAVEQDGEVAYDVPYPFSVLLARIRARLSTSAGDPLKRVLIPIGRSLHRHAAAPDYFRYPRVVIGVDAEPAQREGEAGLLLRDRLYLGYQEKANSIEVISYNNEAGRFEFQLVHNYAPGLKPRVHYANRALCMSCHQNAAPIFPRPPWLETDANFKIATRISEARPSAYTDSLLLSRFGPPSILDYSSDRATYYSSYQLLWREGCGGDTREAVSCRAAVLLALLQYRLTASWNFDEGSPRYRDEFVPVVTRNWQQRWPNGLHIPTADIPDRNPLLTGEHIHAELDPLAVRPPRATWTNPRPIIFTSMIKRLAEFLTESDVKRLDRFLYRSTLESEVAHEIYEGTCQLVKTPESNDAWQLQFSCNDSEQDTTPIISVGGRILIEGERLQRGKIDHLVLDGIPENLFLNLGNASVDDDGQTRQLNARLFSDQGKLNARRHDGNLIQSMTLRWQRSAELGRETTAAFRGQVQLNMRHDFSKVRRAIARMVGDTLAAKSDALSSKPFRRRSIVSAVYRNLDMPAIKWCCHDVASRLPLVVNEHKSVSPSTPYDTGFEALQSFRNHCGACHQTTNQFPPGFLHGNTEKTMRNLEHCAPRILYRLSMWEQSAKARPRSPMPPQHWIRRVTLSEEHWRQSESLNALRSYASELLGAERVFQDVDQVFTTDYDALPPCLPD